MASTLQFEIQHETRYTPSVIGPRLFEHLLTEQRAREVAEEPFFKPEIEALDAGDSHERIARHLAREIERLLRDVGGDDEERVQKQTEIANSLLSHLRQIAPPGPPEEENLKSPAQLLLSMHAGERPARTELPYSITTLLTRARGEPSIGHELSREIATAEHIDALVSFVKVTGVNIIRKALETHASAGKPFRLLTTTYTGATDAEAIESLASLPKVHIRISYDARRTRLHAKAWLFARSSGLDTAYVGSANLSSSALLDGQEWMVKVAAADLPSVITKFRGTFETLWNDPEFEPFDVSKEEDRARLRKALQQERGGSGRASPLAFFTLSPFPFQAEILDRLQAERELHGRYRNLVVAATGTGKTVIAAFDYLRQIKPGALRPKLLFLAHREEILGQALATFRNILRDGAFGELLVGGQEPSRHEHVFASVQSLHSRRLLERFPADFWEHVIVDECHHLPASSYRPIFEKLQPRVLVGLTATPERTDGQSLLPDFQNQIAAELRLWHALERQLLVPFEYYGISDNTDLRDTRFTRGAYDTAELEKLYTGNDRRAAIVIEQTLRRVGDARNIRALGFCVSVAHAEFMAQCFQKAGIPALAVHGQTGDEERRAARDRLERRDVNVLFTCDLYNEGVDLPFVDTLLFLRPTSSASLFLQQLGRGLRLSEKKQSCLVLDFIGQHRADFRFDRTLSAMTGIPRGGLKAAVERGFPTLPSGCHLELDGVAQKQVLEHLKRSLGGGLKRMAEELRTLVLREASEISLKTYLEETGRELEEVFSDKVSWSRLRRAAGLSVPAPGPKEDVLTRKLEHLLHVDEPDRLALYRAVCGTQPRPRLGDAFDSRRILMMAYALFHEQKETFTAESFLALLGGHPAVSAELVELCEALQERVGLSSAPSFPEPQWPLALHRQYTRREVLTAVGHMNETRKWFSREGVLRLPEARTELLFVTLDKSGKRFTPTTSYEDYAISAHYFHWQTQGSVSPTSETGQRYLQQAENGWRFLLFVRPTIHDAFTHLGRVRYQSHVGSRPMSITWKLEVPIPGKWERSYTRLAV